MLFGQQILNNVDYNVLVQSSLLLVYLRSRGRLFDCSKYVEKAKLPVVIFGNKDYFQV